MMDHWSEPCSEQIWQSSQGASSARLIVTGIGCFSVWLFQDDSLLLFIEGCFYYCVVKDVFLHE